MFGFYNSFLKAKLYCNKENHVNFKYTRRFQKKMLYNLALKTALCCPEIFVILAEKISVTEFTFEKVTVHSYAIFLNEMLHQI